MHVTRQRFDLAFSNYIVRHYDPPAWDAPLAGVAKPRKARKPKHQRVAQPPSEIEQMRSFYHYLGRQETRERRAGTDKWIEPFQWRMKIERDFASKGRIL